MARAACRPMRSAATQCSTRDGSPVTVADREAEELHSYRYLDRDKGTVRLPIERAIELVAAEYAEGKLRYPTQPVPVPPELLGGSHAPR